MFPRAELLGLVEGLNADPEIHGILVQLPLPKHIDESKVLLAIDPAKDVDGFHPVNVGKLSTGETEVLAPCTPAGVVEMLVRSGNDPSGKHCVIVGRSNIVGRPMASLLLRKAPGGNATVTVCHSRTPDLGAVTRLADILIVAIGWPEMVTADMVRPGAVVIDVGVNRVDDEYPGAGLPSGGGRRFRRGEGGRQRHHSGARGCGAHDHHHAHDQHGGCRGPPGGNPGVGPFVRKQDLVEEAREPGSLRLSGHGGGSERPSGAHGLDRLPGQQGGAGPSGRDAFLPSGSRGRWRIGSGPAPAIATSP